MAKILVIERAVAAGYRDRLILETKSHFDFSEELIDYNIWYNNRMPDHSHYDQYRIYYAPNSDRWVLVDESSYPDHIDVVIGTFPTEEAAKNKCFELLD